MSKFTYSETDALPSMMDRVIRLLISMLFALGVMLAPATASADVAPASGMPGCTMNPKLPSKAPDRTKMDCCTVACQSPSSTAMLPGYVGEDYVAPARRATLVSEPVKELASITSSGLDPPPRA